jgi:hypothetical protein
MMSSIVPMLFLLSCYLTESLSLSRGSSRLNRAPSGHMASEPKTESLVKDGVSCPNRESKRELCCVGLPSHELVVDFMPSFTA